jgi:hypothetical protein
MYLPIVSTKICWLARFSTELDPLHVVAEPVRSAGVLCPAVFVARLATWIRDGFIKIDLVAAEVTFRAVAVHPLVR